MTKPEKANATTMTSAYIKTYKLDSLKDAKRMSDDSRGNEFLTWTKAGGGRDRALNKSDLNDALALHDLVRQQIKVMVEGYAVEAVS